MFKVNDAMLMDKITLQESQGLISCAKLEYTNDCNNALLEMLKTTF